MSDDKIGRRKYLKYAGAAVAVGAIAAAGYGLSNYYKPSDQILSTTTPVGEKNKVNNQNKNQ